MAQAADAVRLLADQASAVLEMGVGTAQVWCDLDRLVQVLTNLLANAIRFSPTGATVWLDVEQTATEVVFRVRDQGRGIPAAKLETIFEPFVHRVPTHSLEPGMLLGRSLYNQRGDVLLARGARLDESFIASIRQRGYQFVYILDGIADDVEPLGLISQRLRSTTVRNLNAVFEVMAEATRPARDEAAAEGAHVLTDIPPKLTGTVERQLARLQSDVEHLLDEAFDAHILDGVAALKSYDNYTFEHSVDVAFYGLMIGRRLALDTEYLRDLALGCLLHDIGKLYVDDRILNKPGRLTPAEFKQVMRHPVLGFQVVRQMPIASPRPAHIALQHHERQTGDGYPNGLTGTNRLSRTPRERFDTRRMMLLSELVAVADACSTLSSDRPHRAALPAAEVLTTLRSMVEVFPVGVYVRFGAGRYAGCYGVVVACQPGAPNRPRVRLLFDAAGRPIPDGVEVDLRTLPEDAELTALPEAGVSVEEYAHRLALAAR
jgi:HD-GYP domain-containing protein (c-di-GMP phosphodiesterase class II)